MFKFLTKASLLILGLASLGHATAGGRGLPGPTLPVVLKTAVDFKENVLVISGRHFGTAAPTVRLAEEVLDVKHFSEKEIVVSLPPDTQAATYHLTVTSGGRYRSTSEPFSVAYAPRGLN